MRVLLPALLLLGCARGEDQAARMKALRAAYSEAIASDFIAGLHSDEVDKVLLVLDRLPGGTAISAEAADFAVQIRATRGRNPVAVVLDAGAIFAAAVDKIPEAASTDPAESIWMRALKVGAFRADFERYWLGCFQPVAGNPDRWRSLDVPPCRRRPGFDRIAEVRFVSGQISELIGLEAFFLEGRDAGP
jgi:hypothetical protein